MKNKHHSISLSRTFKVAFRSKILTLLFAGLGTINVSVAQTKSVDQTTINGKNYLVYPHQIAVTDMSNYYLALVDSKEVIKRDELNEKIVSVTEVPLTELEKKAAQGFVKNSKKYSKGIDQLFEMDPFFLVTVIHSYDDDPTPALRPLPDGDYVIFYRDIPYIKNRVMRYKNDVPAAYISIKNNVIEGESKWYYPQGKLYMQGMYQGSEKEGEWKAFEYRENYEKTPTYDPKKSIQEQVQSIVYDTITTRINYSNGLRNGEFTVYNNQELMSLGNYTMDKKTGLWETYAFKEEISFDEKGRLFVKTTNEKYLSERFTLRTDNKRGKSIILRDAVIPYEFYEYQYNGMDSLELNNTFSALGESDEYYELGDFPNFSSFYDVLIDDTTDLDLLEENINSYEGEEYEEEYFNEELIYEAEDYNPYEIYEVVNGKRYTINQLIDSIGYLYKYEGVVERYYSNGQLQYRFEVKDGSLVKEEPVYWDNGQIANEIVFLSDSNQYVQNFYDYNGKKYHEIWFDEKGNVLTNASELERHKLTIRGRNYEKNYGASTFYYASNKELLNDSISDRVLVMEQLYKVDTSIASQSWYYPESRMLKTIDQNLLHEDVRLEEVQFSDDFNNVNISMASKFQNIELRTIQNGFLNEYLKEGISDTFNMKNFVYEYEYKYSGEGSDELWVNDKLYTGSFKLVDNTSKLKVKATDKSIQIGLPTVSKDGKIYNKTVKNYLKNGKRNKLLEGYTPSFGGTPFLTRTVLGMFPELYSVFKHQNEYPDYRFDGYEEEELNYRDTKKSKKSQYTSVEGQYLNGKPEGIWTYRDQKGKVRSTIAYKNGEAHGENLYYRFATPKEKEKAKNKDPYAYQYVDPMEKYYQYPEKKTYYLESNREYKNGLLNGPSVTRSWKGDTLNYVNYVDGRKEGMEFNRNILLYNQSNFQNGVADGKTKTYLTIPGKDTILIFDLSLKNGALQGESVAYHTNGKIAKKGFFLMGQPIDDYEAYDTLGNKYQYVKFQYNQPVEEKIWEENELSIRYEFDWRDSIPFYFGDITGSSSIERLLYEVGYRDNSLYQPYYGRPSLVDKSGIDYDITKYYPNDTIARTGLISKGVKKGCWKYYNYQGKKMCEVEYFDTIISVNDSIKFKSKGVLFYLDEKDQVLSKNYIIEKFEKYDCSHTDHNEERLLYCFWEKDSTQHRRNGYVKNYHDNGAIQNEGMVKDGLPTGVWKMYDVNGNLSQVGEYVMGKRNGRWLKGDLGTVKNMSEICLNPNLENVEAILSYQEKLLDVSVITYKMGKELKRKYFGINQNSEAAPDGYYEDGYYPEGY